MAPGPKGLGPLLFHFWPIHRTYIYAYIYAYIYTWYISVLLCSKNWNHKTQPKTQWLGKDNVQMRGDGSIAVFILLPYKKRRMKWFSFFPGGLLSVKRGGNLAKNGCTYIVDNNADSHHMKHSQVSSISGSIMLL